ncbi:MAG: hypothetical protein J7K38_05920 [Thermoplasmata archaeon]|nr:hypothetical protein [Thermoplasmata archaeon]
MKFKSKSLIIFMLFFVSTIITVAGMPAPAGGMGREITKVIHVKATFSNPEILENPNTSELHVEIDNLETWIHEEGKPILPVFRKTFLIPFGSKIKNITCRVSEIHSMILPKGGIEVSRGARWFGTDDIMDVQSNDVPTYPENWYSYRIGAGIKDGQHVNILTVELYPVRYVYSNDTLEFVNEIELTLTYTESKMETFRETSNYDLMIIAPSNFVPALERLAKYKDSRGIKTEIVSLEEIYSKYSGYDEAEKIKKAIKNEVENNGIRYVLLVGSIDKLPIRKTHFIRKWENQYHNLTLLTDLYYSDIYDADGKFCSWDSNGNGKYGEMFYGVEGEDDEIDLYPDVYLGRLACKNVLEVNVVVNKIIQYESRTGNWFKRLLVIGGDTFPGWGVIEGEFVTEKTAEILSDFSTTKLWATLGNLKPLNIHIELSKGYGFVHYSGHGFEYGISTHPVGSEEWIGTYVTPYATMLFNGYRLPVIFFDACLTAKLDFNSSDLRDDGIPIPFNMKFPCFAWYLVKKPLGGAVATIGATRVAFTFVDSSGVHAGASRLALDFFSAYHNTSILGEMFVEAQIAYIENAGKDYFTLEEFILLGDPSLKVGGYGI